MVLTGSLGTNLIKFGLPRNAILGSSLQRIAKIIINIFHALAPDIFSIESLFLLGNVEVEVVLVGPFPAPQTFLYVPFSELLEEM